MIRMLSVAIVIVATTAPASAGGWSALLSTCDSFPKGEAKTACLCVYGDLEKAIDYDEFMRLRDDAAQKNITTSVPGDLAERPKVLNNTRIKTGHPFWVIIGIVQNICGVN